jgi:hypothetical protein
MEPIELVAQMAATLRAGGMAWPEAMKEAVYGLSLAFHNAESIQLQLNAALPKPPENQSTPLVVPAGISISR